MSRKPKIHKKPKVHHVEHTEQPAAPKPNANPNPGGVGPAIEAKLLELPPSPRKKFSSDDQRLEYIRTFEPEWTPQN